MSHIEGRPFTDVLGELEGGDLLRQLTSMLYEVGRAVRDTRKEGTIKLAVKISPTGRSFILDAKAEAKIPEHDRPSTTFFMMPDGTLMRMMTALAAVLLSGQALAADYRPGPYAGIVIGYAAGNIGTNAADLATDGVPVSGVLGYTFKFPSTDFVIGAEAEATWDNVKGSQTEQITLTAKSDYTLGLKARAGMTFGPALMYGLGGVAWSRSELEATNGILTLADKATGMKYLLGAGVDLQMTNTLALRLEAVRQFASGQEWTLGGASTKLDDAQTTLKLGVIFNLN